MAETLIELGGDDPRPLLRAPYGALNERVVSVVVSEGYALPHAAKAFGSSTGQGSRATESG
jgi:hypothetical protein